MSGRMPPIERKPPAEIYDSTDSEDIPFNSSPDSDTLCGRATRVMVRPCRVTSPSRDSAGSTCSEDNFLHLDPESGRRPQLERKPPAEIYDSTDSVDIPFNSSPDSDTLCGRVTRVMVRPCRVTSPSTDSAGSTCSEDDFLHLDPETGIMHRRKVIQRREVCPSRHLKDFSCSYIIHTDPNTGRMYRLMVNLHETTLPCSDSDDFPFDSVLHSNPESGRMVRLRVIQREEIFPSTSSGDNCVDSFLKCDPVSGRVEWLTLKPNKICPSTYSEDHPINSFPGCEPEGRAMGYLSPLCNDMITPQNEDENLSIHSLDESDFLTHPASSCPEKLPAVLPQKDVDKKPHLINSLEVCLRRIHENLASMDLILDQSLKEYTGDSPEKRGGCFQWLFWRKKERVNVKGLGLDAVTVINSILRDCSQTNAELENLKNHMSDLETLNKLFGKCSKKFAKLNDRAQEMQTKRNAAQHTLESARNVLVQSSSPGNVPVSGQTGLCLPVTSAPPTLEDTLQVPPSALRSPRDIPPLLTLHSYAPAIASNPNAVSFPQGHKPHLAPITNVSEKGMKLLQEIAARNSQQKEETKISNKDTKRAKKQRKRVKKEEVNERQQEEDVHVKDIKNNKSSLRKRFLQWLLPKLRCKRK
ncbi:uncharacterized protein LOC105014103 isoform X2 [Esox lucius]|uniref:uncharacterized protein LOC105014103 isoform X2 n=1 Tax=Esox lucius TaxID=8010 RepID=UPI001477051E|nr:uncharacterized protein LOC105014103 isoform X2 [Esox lucius]